VLAQQSREFGVDHIEEKEDLNHVGRGDVRLIEGENLAIVESNLEVFVAGGDKKHASFSAEREHLERGL
jgi:hypothetical protein